jgi:heat shock protein HslJ
VYLEFSPSEKRFSGNGGCNRISGKYALENKNRIQFAEVISTKMSCPDITFETAVLSALAEVNGFDKNGTALVLKKDGQIILKFEARPINTPAG